MDKFSKLNADIKVMDIIKKEVKKTSQKALARKLGLSVTPIKCAMREDYCVSNQLILAVANRFGYSLDYLYSQEDI